MTDVLLDACGLVVHYPTRDGQRYILNNVSLSIYRGETLALIGESGSGKTTLARALLRLTPLIKGSVIFEGTPIHNASGTLLRAFRRQAQMVFQNPFASLNPRQPVESIVAEPLLTHTSLSKDERRKRVTAVLEEVGLSSDYLNRYAHQLSGGQAQRVGIARAIILNPKLVVLDEPTSALDVSVQAQILMLLSELQARYALTYLFISHDLSIVKLLSHRVAVMCGGEIVELADINTVFQEPKHEYTQKLLKAAPPPLPPPRPLALVKQDTTHLTKERDSL